MRPQLGDKLRVRVSTPWIEFDHYGIYVGPRGLHGEDVVHNDKQGGVRLVHYSTFRNGQTVYIENRVSNGWQAQVAVVRRALRLIGTGYDLFFFNCEHAANYALIGNRMSSQVRRAVAVAAVVAVGLVVLSNYSEHKNR